MKISLKFTGEALIGESMYSTHVEVTEELVCQTLSVTGEVAFTCRLTPSLRRFVWTSSVN